MNNQIRHEGIISSISPGHVVVSIVQRSACLSCKLSKQCMTSEMKVKEVDVYTSESSKYAVGDTVIVQVSQTIGMKAVLIGFVVPVIAVLLGVIIALNLTSESGVFPMPEPNNQVVAAFAGLLMLIPYYICLYFMRSHLSRKIVFTIVDN